MENFFSRDMLADVMSVHNRNMKHARVSCPESSNVPSDRVLKSVYLGLKIRERERESLRV